MKRNGDKPAVDCNDQFLYICGSRDPRYSRVDDQAIMTPMNSAEVCSCTTKGVRTLLLPAYDTGAAAALDTSVDNVAACANVRGEGVASQNFASLLLGGTASGDEDLCFS